MAWVITTPRAGLPLITATDTAAKVALGTIVDAADETYGAGEFVYLLGVGSTIVGSLVTYDPSTWQTALTTHAPVQARPVAVAMSVNVASQYGWYQISGKAVIKKTAILIGAQVTLGLGVTAGRVRSSSTAGLQIANARSANVATISATVSVITAHINRPHLQTQVT